MSIVTRFPPGLDGYNKPESSISGDKSSLLDYQHIGYLVQLPRNSTQSSSIMLPTVRPSESRNASSNGLQDEEEGIQRALWYPVTPEIGQDNEVSKDQTILSKIQAPFRWVASTGKLLFGLPSHSAEKYSESIFSARDLFASYLVVPSVVPNASYAVPAALVSDSGA